METGETLFFWTNYYKEHQEIGTTRKIYSEISFIRKRGISVFYTAYLDDGVAIFDNNDQQIQFVKYHVKNSNILAVTRKDHLIRITVDYIASHKFDYYLLRINMFSRRYLKMLTMMKNQNSFVMMESLSYFPDLTYKDRKDLRYFVMLNSIKRKKKKIKSLIDLMLTEGKIDDFYGVPCIEFGMGTEVDRYREHNYKGSSNELNLVMVGCEAYYHGLDRMLESLSAYYQSPNVNRMVYLHLVGNVLEEDKKRIEILELDKYVRLYGSKYGKELEDIYDQCNIALGPLGQFRAKKKDTGLKTKEYFAKGIPYIYTGEEGMIEENYPYIHHIPDDESLIDLEDIFVFYNGIKTDKNIAINMREKAAKVFSWDSIFERVFQKVKTIRGI